MNKNEVQIGDIYIAKVSDRLAPVRIDSTHSKGGWNATNTKTGKRIHIKSAQRLRYPADGCEKKTEPNNSAEPAAIGNDGRARAPSKAATNKIESRNVNAPGAAVAKGETAEEPGVAATKKARSKKAGGKQKAKRVSALDAAAQILAQSSKPMRAKELIATIAEQRLWSSPAGKTPHATLYAAMMREARDKGTASRFRKVERGLFEFHALAENG